MRDPTERVSHHHTVIFSPCRHAWGTPRHLNKCQKMARDTIYSPGIDCNIEDYIKRCQISIKINSLFACRAPMQLWSLSRPMTESSCWLLWVELQILALSDFTKYPFLIAAKSLRSLWLQFSLTYLLMKELWLRSSQMVTCYLIANSSPYWQHSGDLFMQCPPLYTQNQIDTSHTTWGRLHWVLLHLQCWDHACQVLLKSSIASQQEPVFHINNHCPSITGPSEMPW